MRISLACLSLAIVAADPGSTQIRCAPIVSTVSIGKISPRPSFNSVMSTVPVSCVNTGTTPSTHTILLSIDTTAIVMANNDQHTSIPLKITFGTNFQDPMTAVCHDLTLNPSESRLFDIPITIGMFVKGQEHGFYETSIPIMARTLMSDEIKELCMYVALESQVFLPVIAHSCLGLLLPKTIKLAKL